MMPEEEIADLVVMASVLCNFDPSRSLPIWLIIVGPPATGKTEIITSILDWKFTHQLPNPLSAAYFLSARNKKESALYVIAEQQRRILWMQDMLQFTRMANDKELGRVYAQLLDLHDGRFRRETGWTTDVLEYNHETHGLLGWLGSATEKFYDFQDRTHEWGSRFLVYHFRGKRESWESTKHLKKIDEVTARVTAADKKIAKGIVQGFLERAISEIGEFKRVRIPDHFGDRIRAAVTLVQRCIATGKDSDPGTRLYKRLDHLARMFAFMDARFEVEEDHAMMACRVGLSQIPVERREVLEHAVINRSVLEGWDMLDLCNYVGGIRQVYAEPLSRMLDVGIVDKIPPPENKKRNPKDATKYRLSAKAAELIDQFDPTGSLLITRRK